jgi:hypothetical protein
MTLRTSFGALCLAALASAGCALPQNSPLEHLSKIQPIVEPRTNVLPPATMLMHPGPGVDGPGPGVMLAGYHRPIYGPGAGGCAGGPGGAGGGFAMADMLTSQIGFVGPDGMRVRWDVAGRSLFDSEPLVVPGRFNFPQGAIYRLKLTDIPGYPGVELYPTLEVAPTVPRTEAFIAHNYIPFQLTDEDFKQVLSGNFVTKVIYLPDPQYQELALAGVETLVSTRLDPGVDPIVEADRRGSILAIIRLGNKDLQTGGWRCCSGRLLGTVPTGSSEELHCRGGWRTDGSTATVRRWLGHSGIWNAILRHADRTAWSAARAAGCTGRLAEARHCQRDSHAHSAADRSGSY